MGVIFARDSMKWNNSSLKSRSVFLKVTRPAGSHSLWTVK